MEINTAAPAPSPAHIATLKAALMPPPVPAQTALTEQTPMPASPAADGPAPKTAPPAAPAAVVDPVHDVPGDVMVEDNASTRASIDSEAEEKLTLEIVILWGDCKSANTAVRLMRAEGKSLRLALAEDRKSLRLALAEKLHAMKQILVGTGREGRWAPYLREQRLPLTTADRLVAQHESTLAPRAEKLPTGELSKIDEVRQLAKNMLPKVSRLLTSQELVYEFMHTLIWGIDVAEMSYTDAGFEIPKIGSEDAPEVDAPVAEPASPAPAAP